MNFWVCPSCSKKVSENIKACPYCKALRQEEIRIVSESNTNHYKIIIAVLGLIVVAGGFYMLGKSKSESEPPRPVYTVQVKQTEGSSTIKKQVPATAILAYKALKKVEARTEVGVNRMDYTPVIAEAKTAVNLYSESPESKLNPELTSSILKTMEHYENAKSLWDLKLKDSSFLPEADFRQYWNWASIELKKTSIMIGNSQ